LREFSLRECFGDSSTRCRRLEWGFYNRFRLGFRLGFSFYDRLRLGLGFRLYHGFWCWFGFRLYYGLRLKFRLCFSNRFRLRLRFYYGWNLFRGRGFRRSFNLFGYRLYWHSGCG